MSDLVRELFFENPMLDEVARARRRFLRGGTDRPVVNYVVAGLALICYLWLLADIVRYREDFAEALIWAGLILVTLITPAITYGAVAGEREKATWDALILTRLTPGQIIAGKLLWRLGVVTAILIVLAIPGVLSRAITTDANNDTNSALLLGLLEVFIWGVFISAFGVAVSSVSRRSVTALGVIAGTMLVVLALIPMLISIVEPRSFGYYGRQEESPLQMIFYHINPFVALGELFNGYDPDSGYTREYQAQMWGWLPTLFFAAGAAFSLIFTHNRLKRLEEPRRRGG